MLQPIGDRVLVKPAKQEEKTKSGIYIPDSAQEKPQEGEVVAVGEGTYHGSTFVSFADMGIKPGVKVMYSKYGPTEIKIGSDDYIVLSSDDIMGIITK